VPIEQKIGMVLPYLQKAEGGGRKAEGGRGTGDGGRPGGTGVSPVLAAGHGQDARATLAAVVAAAGDRIKVAGDILEFTYFFLPDDQLPYDEQAFDKCVRKPGAAELLRKFRERLAAAEPFDAPTLEALMHAFVAAEGIKIGEIIHAVRVAVTGKSVGLGLFDSLAILGRDHCLARIDRALGMP